MTLDNLKMPREYRPKVSGAVFPLVVKERMRGIIVTTPAVARDLDCLVVGVLVGNRAAQHIGRTSAMSPQVLKPRQSTKNVLEAEAAKGWFVPEVGNDEDLHEMIDRYKLPGINPYFNGTLYCAAVEGITPAQSARITLHRRVVALTEKVDTVRINGYKYETEEGIPLGDVHPDVWLAAQRTSVTLEKIGIISGLPARYVVDDHLPDIRSLLARNVEEVQEHIDGTI